MPEPTPIAVKLVDWAPGFAAMAQEAEDLGRLVVLLAVVVGGLLGFLLAFVAVTVGFRR